MVIERIKITEEQKQWFVDNYPNMRNQDLAEELGISTQTVTRMAQRRGLVKSDEFMKYALIRRIEAARLANKNRHNPNSLAAIKKYQFGKGNTCLSMYGKEVEEKRINKSTETRKDIIKRDRARIAFGLPRKSHYKLGKQNPKRAYAKWYLTRRGYIVDDVNRVAYYNSETQRGALTEKRNAIFYVFKRV